MSSARSHPPAAQGLMDLLLPAQEREVHRVAQESVARACPADEVARDVEPGEDAVEAGEEQVGEERPEHDQEQPWPPRPDPLGEQQVGQPGGRQGREREEECIERPGRDARRTCSGRVPWAPVCSTRCVPSPAVCDAGTRQSASFRSVARPGRSLRCSPVLRHRVGAAGRRGSGHGHRRGTRPPPAPAARQVVEVRPRGRPGRARLRALDRGGADAAVVRRAVDRGELPGDHRRRRGHRAAHAPASFRQGGADRRHRRARPGGALGCRGPGRRREPGRAVGGPGRDDPARGPGDPPGATDRRVRRGCPRSRRRSGLRRHVRGSQDASRLAGPRPDLRRAG